MISCYRFHLATFIKKKSSPDYVIQKRQVHFLQEVLSSFCLKSEATLSLDGRHVTL